MIQGDRPDEPRAEIIDVSAAPPRPDDDRSSDSGQVPLPGRALGPIGQRSSRGLIVAIGVVAVLSLGLVLAVIDHGQPPILDSSDPTLPLASQLGPTPPTEAGGLPVLSVGDALTSLSVDPLGQAELAVRGWYTAVRVTETCQPTFEPVGTCVSGWTSILESRPDTQWSGDGRAHPTQSGTSVLNLLLIDPVPPPDLPSTFSGPSLEVVPPSPQVLIGHFNDDRVAACAGSGPHGCGATFVVDALADPSGSVVSNDGTNEVTSTSLTVDAVNGLIRSNLRPGGVVLGFGAVTWASGLATQTVVEPSVVGPPSDGRTVWLVRGYVAPVPGSASPAAIGPTSSWMAIDDGTGQIWGPMAGVPAIQPLGDLFPTTIDGLPVESISAALARGPDPSGLIALGGYLSNDRAVEGCPPAPATDKPNPCSGTQLVLVDQPAFVLQPNDATFLYDIVVPPGAASIRPVVLPGATVVDPWAAATTIAGRLRPERVVLVGGFGDRRSPECAPRPGGGNPGCDRSFVIDQIAWVEGVAQGPSESSDASIQPTHDQNDVDQAVAAWFLPGQTPVIVSITSTLPATAGELAGVDLDGRPSGVYWVVLVVSMPLGGPTGTYLVFDDRTMDLVEVSSGG